MGVDRGIDQHREKVVLFGEPGRVEPAERAADHRNAAARRPRELGLRGSDREARQVGQGRADELLSPAALLEVTLEGLRLRRLRGAVEPVKVQDHARVTGALRAESASSSASWIPPNPPFDMTST